MRLPTPTLGYAVRPSEIRARRGFRVETLQQVERKVELVTGIAADGSPVVASFDEGDLSLEEKAQARSRRRSKADTASEEGRGRKPRGGGDEDDGANDGGGGRLLAL